MASVREVVTGYFREHGLKYNADEESPVLYLNMTGVNGEWPCRAVVGDEDGLFVFGSLVPVDVPLERFAAMSEFIVRLNNGMRLGHFNFSL